MVSIRRLGEKITVQVLRLEGVEIANYIFDEKKQHLYLRIIKNLPNLSEEQSKDCFIGFIQRFNKTKILYCSPLEKY